MELIILLAALFVLVIATITDIRVREVPDFLNYGLIFFGFFINIVFSIYYWDHSFIIDSLLGFGIFWLLAIVLYYTSQWGGGDAKLLMGLGALIGVQLNTDTFLLGFIINLFIVGAVYGLFWSIIIAIKNKKRFIRDLKILLAKKQVIMIKRIFIFLALIVIVLVLLPIDRNLKLYLSFVFLASYLIFYLWIFVKSVENCQMYKDVLPVKLTEGDWIAKDVWVKNMRKISAFDYLRLKHKENRLFSMFSFVPHSKIKKILSYKSIASLKKSKLSRSTIDKIILRLKKQGYHYDQIKVVGPKDNGIEKWQISFLRQYAMKTKVTVKEGIPFVPSFLLGFIVTYIIGNVVLLL